MRRRFFLLVLAAMILVAVSACSSNTAGTSEEDDEVERGDELGISEAVLDEEAEENVSSANDEPELKTTNYDIDSLTYPETGVNGLIWEILQSVDTSDLDIEEVSVDTNDVNSTFLPTCHAIEEMAAKWQYVAEILYAQNPECDLRLGKASIVGVRDKAQWVNYDFSFPEDCIQVAYPLKAADDTRRAWVEFEAYGDKVRIVDFEIDDQSDPDPLDKVTWQFWETKAEAGASLLLLVTDDMLPTTAEDMISDMTQFGGNKSGDKWDRVHLGWEYRGDISIPYESSVRGVKFLDQ